jgi:hypothetical protein
MKISVGSSATLQSLSAVHWKVWSMPRAIKGILKITPGDRIASTRERGPYRWLSSAVPVSRM